MSSIEEFTSLKRAVLFVYKDVGAVGWITSNEGLQILGDQSETARKQQACSRQQLLLLSIHEKILIVVDTATNNNEALN